MDLEVRVLQRQCGIGRHAACQIAIAGDQEVSPVGVFAYALGSILSIAQPTAASASHRERRTEPGREWRKT